MEPRVNQLLRQVRDRQGSDLHLLAGVPPKIRIHGQLVPTRKEPLTNDEVENLLLPLLDERRLKIFERKRDLDWAYALPDVARFRVVYFRQLRGMGGVFRLIPHEILPVQKLGVPEIVLRFAHLRNGLVLCTGPTGTGKSTTLAAIIDYINRNFRRHIVTIEEPIEYVHENKMSYITQREVGIDTMRFADALRAASREDPDVILVGELRDLETISLAITAAEAGYLVFATLHTNSAAKTVDRIIDVFPEGQQNQIRIMLSVALKGIIAQLLIPCKDGKGRVPVNEILFSSFSLGNIIREGAIYKIVSLIEAGRGEGMQLMDDAIMQRYKAGLVSAKHAHLYGFAKNKFAHLLKEKEAPQASAVEAAS